MYDFANILFSGKCSAKCYFCIGNELDPFLNQPNLDIFPLRNMNKFIRRIQDYKVNQVVLTGTNTDPQLYQYEIPLLELLRKNLPEQAKIALHTNGRLALRRMEIFNAYDRATLSIPSFNPDTYHKMMGVPGIPDLENILAFSQIPIKLSCLVDNINLPELPGYLERCFSLGTSRVVLRKKYADMRRWESLINFSDIKLYPIAVYQGNPIYEYKGVEVTLWDFARSLSKSINLFSNGMISDQYLLVNANLTNLRRAPKLKLLSGVA